MNKFVDSMAEIESGLSYTFALSTGAIIGALPTAMVHLASMPESIVTKAVEMSVYSGMAGVVGCVAFGVTALVAKTEVENDPDLTAKRIKGFLSTSAHSGAFGLSSLAALFAGVLYTQHETKKLEAVLATQPAVEKPQPAMSYNK